MFEPQLRFKLNHVKEKSSAQLVKPDAADEVQLRSDSQSGVTEAPIHTWHLIQMLTSVPDKSVIIGWLQIKTPDTLFKSNVNHL